jgi:hypothetical protein
VGTVSVPQTSATAVPMVPAPQTSAAAVATVSATETSAAASRGFSDQTGYTNITAGESSGANTPPPGNHLGADGAPEVVSKHQLQI